MKNIFKIILILCLGMFVVTGCADNSSGGNGGGNTENTGGDNNGGDNTGDGGDNNGGDNTDEYDTPEFTKLISLGGLSYGETADGKRYVWGNAGELAGAGNKDEVTTPVEVDFTINKILDNGTKYVLTDKGLYAWGNNGYGQVGDGTTENVTKPHKAVEGNIKEFRVSYSSNSANYATYYALTDDGLYAWGYNYNGLVGNGTTTNVLSPYKAVNGNIKDLKFLYNGTVYVTVYALTEDGLYAWGYNEYGQVGNGEEGYEKDEDGNDVINKPKKVLKPYKAVEGNIKDFIESAIFFYATYYASTEDGDLYAWGYNEYGQVGNGDSGYEKDKDGNDDYFKPKKVLTPHKVKGITGNIKKIIAPYNDGKTGRTAMMVYVLTDTGLYAWGNNGYGQVGNGTIENVTTPNKTLEGNIKDLIISGIGINVTCYALTEDGLYAWGRNRNGQVGNGNTDDVLTPYIVREITGNINKLIITTDYKYSSYSNYFITVYALAEDGLYAWGINSYGQVGDGNSGYEKDGYGKDNYYDPKKVLIPYKAINGNINDLIISGSDNSATYYALTADGLYVWGSNRDGQVGNGTTDEVLTPYKAVEGNIKEFIIPGSSNFATYYALTDKGLYVWGSNENGQVGNGESGYEKDEDGNNDYSKPKQVLTPYKAVEGNIKEFIISGSYTNTTCYALTENGLYAWGDNEYGKVGNGQVENYNDKVTSPHKVEEIDGNIKEVKIDYDNVYVLTDTGLYAWGANEYGQVGNGESGYEKDEDGNDDRYNPKKVLRPYKAVAGNIKEFIISVYKEYSTNYYTYYALTDTGLFAWGHNNYGQVGNGESGYEKGEDGNDDYSKPRQVLNPYKVKIEKQN